MRADIKNIPLEEIYKDYLSMMDMKEKYYYSGKATTLEAATETILTILKDEIVKRKIQELKNEQNDRQVSWAMKQINEEV